MKTKKGWERVRKKSEVEGSSEKFRRRKYLFKECHHLFLSHVFRPVPGCIAGVVACVDFGAKTQEKLCTLHPTDVGTVVQRSVSCSFNLVDVHTILNRFLNCCRESTSNGISKRVTGR